MDITDIGRDTLPGWVSAASRAVGGGEPPKPHPLATSLNTLHPARAAETDEPTLLVDSVQGSEPVALSPGSVAERAVVELTAAGLIEPPDPQAAGRGGVGVVAGRYELRGLLGMGGRGLVFLAHDRQGDCQVALKTLRPEFLNDAAARQAFVGEAKDMNRIPAHAGVLVVKDFGGVYKPFYVTEYLRGGTLGDAIRSDGPLDAARSLRYARDLAAALGYVHTRHGKLHRDVKPGNVLLDGDGSARLADFGLLWQVGAGQGAFRAGTLPYMPPEVLNGERKDVGFEWDVYGFGATLYEMLTGQAPYADRLKALPRSSNDASGAAAQQLREMVEASAPTPILTLNRQADSKLVKIAEWSMARDPRDRYFGTGDIVEDLERVAAGQRPQGPARGSVDVRGKRPRAWGRWVAIVAVACGVAAAASVMLDSTSPYAKATKKTPKPDAAPEVVASGSLAAPAVVASESPTAATPGPMLTQERQASPLGLSFEAVGGASYRIARPERWALLRGQRFTSVNDLPWDPVAERAAMTFKAQAREASYLTVLSRSSDGVVVQLMPNVFEPDNRLEAGVARTIPRVPTEASTPYWFEAAPPVGTDTVWAVLTERPFEIVGADASALPASGFRVVPEDFKIAVEGRVFASFEEAFADRWQKVEMPVTVSWPDGL